MQGSSAARSKRIGTAALFGASFVAGSVAIFGLASAAADVLGTARWPAGVRAATAGLGFLAFAGADVQALRTSSYSPLGPRRQTPKVLQHHYGSELVATVWGFDTGLAVTTVRVASATWGALLAVVLGLAGWETGLAYGLSYAVPALVLLRTHRLGRGEDPGPAIDSFLRRRPALQGVSAASLILAAGLLLVRSPI